MSNLIGTILTLLPFIVFLWLASLADRRSPEGGTHPVPAVLAYVLLIGFYLTMFLVGLLMWSIGISPVQLPADFLAIYEQFGIDPASVKPALTGIGLGLWLPSLLGIVLLIRPVRRLLAYILPIDPLRTVHAVALSYSMLILMNLMTTVGAGLENLASLVEAGSEGPAPVTIATVWTQAILLALMGLIGTGWLSRRSLRDTARRLGLTLPSGRLAALALLIGIGMAPLILLLEQAANNLGAGPGAGVERLSEALIGPLFRSLPGILTVGLGAALGEEIVFRGALQPRFGLLASTVLFALTHANYGISLATAAVLIMGLVFGLLRQRGNTVAAMITHASYNITLGMIAYLGLA